MKYVLLIALLSLVSCQRAVVAPTNPNDFTDLSGISHKPMYPVDAKAHVLIFTTTDCPIANSYAPEISRIASEYRVKGFRFFLVHVDPDVTAKVARRHALEYSLNLPVILDTKHRLVSAAGASVTPEVAVVLPGSKIAYHGRIDNWYARLGKKRVIPTERDLRVALDAIIADVPIGHARTEAIGCYIPILN